MKKIELFVPFTFTFTFEFDLLTKNSLRMLNFPQFKTTAWQRTSKFFKSTMQIDELIKKDGNVGSSEKLNKCNQCGFASSHARSLSRHLKTHSGQKSNKWDPRLNPPLMRGKPKRGNTSRFQSWRRKQRSIWLKNTGFIERKHCDHCRAGLTGGF